MRDDDGHRSDDSQSSGVRVRRRRPYSKWRGINDGTMITAPNEPRERS
jgi:hypothetical protein